MQLAVTGAGGRMGRTVVAAALERGHDVPVAVTRSDGEPEVEGIPIELSSELLGLLDAHRPDVLVDFSAPESSVRYVEHCVSVGVPAVVGTTGFDDDQAAAIRAAGEHVPVLRAPNFARGVLALVRAVEAAVDALPGYDVEVTETHHSGKRDAPSGTARELLDRIEDARDDADSISENGGHDEDVEYVHGREGEAPRQPGEIGVHSRRAGDVNGQHEILLAANHEVVTLTHRAEDRGVYAAGALDAAEWLRDCPPGYYTFEDVVG